MHHWRVLGKILWSIGLKIYNHKNELNIRFYLNLFVYRVTRTINFNGMFCREECG